MKMMKKGKGYPEHVVNKSKTYGNSFATDVVGPRSRRAVLNEWPDYAWKMPEPAKKSRKSTLFG